MMTLVLENIKEAQSKAIKEENRKSKQVIGQILPFDMDIRGLLTHHGQIWVLYTGGARRI